MPAFSFRDLISKLLVDYSSNELSHYEYGNGISLNDRKVRDIIRLNHPPNTTQPTSITDSSPVSISMFNNVHAIPISDQWNAFPMTMTTGYSNWYNYNGIAGYDETAGTYIGSLLYSSDYYFWQGTARVRAVYLKQTSATNATPKIFELRCEIARTNFSSDPGTPGGYYSWWGYGKTFSYAHRWGPGLGGWGSYFNTNTNYWHQYWNTNNNWGYNPTERYAYGSSNVWDDIEWKFRLSTAYVGFGKTAIAAS